MTGLPALPLVDTVLPPSPNPGAFGLRQPTDWFARQPRVRRPLKAAPYVGRVRIDRTRFFAGELGLDAVVAIPVRNEDTRLRRCLNALQASVRGASARCGVVIVVNNTTDRSAEVAWDWASSSGLPCLVSEITLPDEIAHVGYARRLALDIAEGVGQRNAVLLSTDADTVVGWSWVSDLIAAVQNGAALVATGVEANALELADLPQTVRAAGHAESTLKQRYQAVWNALTGNNEPCPLLVAAGGASFAIGAQTYRAVGRLAPLPAGEDRALTRSVILHGGSVDIHRTATVTTSCRLDARAAGGMADALLARCTQADPDVDPLLTPARLFVLRAIAWQLSTVERSDDYRALGHFVEEELHRSQVAWHFETRGSTLARGALLDTHSLNPLSMTGALQEASAAARLLGALTELRSATFPKMAWRALNMLEVCDA